MPNTLNYSGMEPTTADGTETCIAPAMLTLTGASAAPSSGAAAMTLMRFADGLTPSNGAGKVADLWMIGGYANPGLWQMVTYTNTSGALSAAATLTLSGCEPAGSAGQLVGQAPALLALTGGVQGTYGSAQWFRFATAFTPANGQTVADLVMPGGTHNSERWYVVVYTNTGGVLS